MASLGSLVADMRLESAAFRRDLGRATQAVRSQTAQQRRAFQELNREARSLNRQFSALQNTARLLAGAFALREFGKFTRAAIDAGAAIGDTAAKVGLTSKSLQQLRFAAEQSGVSTKTLDLAMQRFSRRLGEVAQGQGELLKTAKAYDVQIRDSGGQMRANVDILRDFSDVIKNAESDQERLRIAFKLFDSEGAALVNTLRDGREGLDAYMQQAVEFGAVMDDRVVAQAKAASDSLARLRSVVSTSFNTEIVRTFAGELMVGADSLRSARDAAQQFGRIVGTTMRAAVQVFKLVAENIKAITAALAALVAFKTAQMFIAITAATLRFVAALRAATTAQAALNIAMRSNPIGAIVSAVAAAVSALFVYKDEIVAVGGTTVQVGKVMHAAWVTVKESVMAVVNSFGNLGRALAQLASGNFDEAIRQLTLDTVSGNFQAVVDAWNDLGPSAAKATEEIKLAGQATNDFIRPLSDAEDKIGDTIKALKRETGQLESQLHAVKDSEKAWDDLKDAQLAFNTVADLHVKTGSEEERVITSLILKREELTDKIEAERDARDEAIQAAKKQVEEQNRLLERQRELALEPFKNAISGIQQSFADMFEDVFSGGVNSFSDLAASVKRVFIKLAAEIAALMVFRPAVAGTLNSIGGSGLSNSLGLGGGQSGGFGLPNLPTGNLFSGFTSGIDSFGSSLGFAPSPGSLSGAAAAHPGAAAQSGFFGSTTTFSGFLGGAGMGAGIGSLTGQLTGGNSTGATIGGAIGGAAGSFFGPVGTVVGGAIGGAVGGLFGNDEPSDKTQVVKVDLRTGKIVNRGGLTGDKYSAENEQLANQVAQQFSQMAAQVGGINETLRVIVGNRDGLRFQLSSGPVVNAGDDPNALIGAIQKALGDEIERAQILGIIKELSDTTTDYEKSLKAVAEQYDLLIKRANRLGIETAVLVAARDREIQAIKDQARAPLVDAAGGVVDFLRSQSLSGDSSLSPTQRLVESQRQFSDLLGRVRGGEVGATRSLTQAAGSLLSVGRDHFASTVEFAGLESFVRSSLLGVAETLTSEEYFNEQVEATKQQTDVLSGDLSEVQKSIAMLGDEVRLLRRQLAA